MTGTDTLTQYYNEMRWRILSLAADFDRVQRASGGAELIASDPRIAALKTCVNELLSKDVGRAERVQMILSDRTDPPRR
jgi:hypothetical protein